MFSGAISEQNLARMGKIYVGKPLRTKSRRELLATIRPSYRRHLRADNGDLPADASPLIPIAKSPEIEASAMH
jgi:hypothetical protein